MSKKEFIINDKKYWLFEDETMFMFSSSMGCILAEGVIFLKDVNALKQFREKTIYTEVFIYDKNNKMFVRADKYIL